EAPQQPRDSFIPLDNELRIVTLLADPETADYPPLHLSAEVNKIHQVLNELKRRPYVQFYDKATRQILEDIVDDERPDVLHFAGYSRFEGDLCLAYGTHLEQGAVVLQDAM